MKSKKYLKFTCFLFLAIFILSCVPVKLINPSFNTTYVKVKINPEDIKLVSKSLGLKTFITKINLLNRGVLKQVEIEE